MKVYVITKTWVNWDGWPISGPDILSEPTFTDEKQALDFCVQQNASQKDPGGNHDNYGYQRIDVKFPATGY
jgi:hypothetical protein